LKDLFKQRAEQLVERAESLSTNQIDSLLGDNSLEKDEEEKEIKMSKAVSDTHFLPRKNTMPSASIDRIGFSIDLTRKDSNMEVESCPSDNKEEKKGEVDEKEMAIAKPNILCGIKRSHSFDHKEEVERSLKDFSCTICMEYMVGAKKLQCGHWFWDQCISFWFLREKHWPICRDKIRDEKNIEWNLVDLTIEHILTRASHNDSSMRRELKGWRSRRHSYDLWKRQHLLKNAKIGDKVDVRDTEFIWCTGYVEKILKSKYNWADLFYIHYDGWSRCYDEFIPGGSERIAPFGLYTTRSDIPKYTRHEGPDDRVYGNVVEGNDNNQQQQQENDVNANNNQEEANEDASADVNADANVDVDANTDANVLGKFFIFYQYLSSVLFVSILR